MLEKTIEEIIKRYHAEVWPNLSLRYLESQRRLPNGNILDLCFKESDGATLVVELKRGALTSPAVSQLENYIAELKTLYPDQTFRGLLVARSASQKALTQAERAGIPFRQIDESLLREIAAKHGLPVDHQSGHRPKLSGNPRVRSMPPRRRGARPASGPETVEFIRNLDSKFPPGSLNHNVPLLKLKRYWQTACPNSPDEHHSIAAAFSAQVLAMLHSSAMSNRSEGAKEKYTTIRTLDGRVAAAIDARLKYVKLDFPLPHGIAEACYTVGEVHRITPRGHSFWVLSKVGTKLSIARAQELLKLGIEFEFQDQL